MFLLCYSNSVYHHYSRCFRVFDLLKLSAFVEKCFGFWSAHLNGRVTPVLVSSLREVEQQLISIGLSGLGGYRRLIWLEVF